MLWSALWQVAVKAVMGRVLQAAEKVAPGSPVAGRAYFITNDDAQPFWGFVGDVIEPLGYGRPRIKLPFYLVFFIACVFEFLVRENVHPSVYETWSLPSNTNLHMRPKHNGPRITVHYILH